MMIVMMMIWWWWWVDDVKMCNCVWQVRHLWPLLLSILLSCSGPFVASQVNALVVFEDLLILSKYLSPINICTILCSSQFGGLVTSLLQISIVFNNLASVRFQKFDNIASEKLFFAVDLFSLQLLLNSSTQLPLRLQQCHTFRLASPPLVRWLLIMWNLL